MSLPKWTKEANFFLLTQKLADLFFLSVSQIFAWKCQLYRVLSAYIFMGKIYMLFWRLQLVHWPHVGAKFETDMLCALWSEVNVLWAAVCVSCSCFNICQQYPHISPFRVERFMCIMLRSVDHLLVYLNVWSAVTFFDHLRKKGIHLNFGLHNILYHRQGMKSVTFWFSLNANRI